MLRVPVHIRAQTAKTCRRLTIFRLLLKECWHGIVKIQQVGTQQCSGSKKKANFLWLTSAWPVTQAATVTTHARVKEHMVVAAFVTETAAWFAKKSLQESTRQFSNHHMIQTQTPVASTKHAFVLDSYAQVVIVTLTVTGLLGPKTFLDRELSGYSKLRTQGPGSVGPMRPFQNLINLINKQWVMCRESSHVAGITIKTFLVFLQFRLAVRRVKLVLFACNSKVTMVRQSQALVVHVQSLVSHVIDVECLACCVHI